MKIAVPWTLSHYIPFEGFHPLYRALFDHAPAGVDIAAWDNVKLHRHFADHPKDRKSIVSLAHADKRTLSGTELGVVACSDANYFYPPDKVLTEALDGEIEFHHTAPFPSLSRPFVFHCESFAPEFLPSTQQGHGGFERHDELRHHYKRIFTDPLCLGIYSHIPETLDRFRAFFSDPVIDGKLFNSRIGLSTLSVNPNRERPRQSVDRPRFLFIDSAHQEPANFFNRGGHIVLRFWKEFHSAGREGKLILGCGRPDDDTLSNHGVDPAFIQSEIGRSILWAEGHLSNHDINALMADAHFFLLPSISLHSASILLAMTHGTVPVVTDTVGTSVYVADGDTAIVLGGVKEATWRIDPNTGVLVDHYERMPSVANSLVTQLAKRVFSLLDSTDAYDAMSHRTSERARTQFCGRTFASEFWDAVLERAKAVRGAPKLSSRMSELTRSLQGCTLDQSNWGRVFESSTQPMLSLDTGASKIFELGGAAVHMFGSPPMDRTDWSVFARYFDSSAPELTFANSLADLGDRIFGMPNDVAAMGQGSAGHSKLQRWASNALLPFPTAHSLASRGYRRMRGVKAFGRLWFQHIQYKRGKIGDEGYVTPVMENVYNFNIVRYFHRYYAIPQGEGPFVASKAEGKLYSETFRANSLRKVISKVNRSKASRLGKIANIPIILFIVRLVGKDRVIALVKAVRRRIGQRG